MPFYSYECKKCQATKTLDCKRGEAPREIDCECSGKFERVVNVHGMNACQEKDVGNTRSEKLRENLKKREQKMSESKDKAAMEHFKSWSKKMTGGQW